MKDIKIQVAGGYIELLKELPFGVNYSAAELQDLSKKNTPYSTTIQVPGTKNNNILFGNLFDINEDFTYYNPAKKLSAKLIIDSTTVINGFIQLRGVNKLEDTDPTSNLIYYDVVLSDATQDFITALGDAELTELDFSEFDHILDGATIENSWNHNYTSGYTYPLLYNGSNGYRPSHFKPAIFYRQYIDKIFEYAKYSVGGSFINDPIFTKEIIPWNGSLADVTIPASEYTRRLFKAGMSTTGTTGYTFQYKGGLEGNTVGDETFTSSILNYEVLDDDSTPPNFDNGTHWNTSNSKWTIDRNGSYNLKGRINLEFSLSTKREIEFIQSATSSSILVTITNHRLDNSQPITITGTTSYDGNHNVIVIDANTIRINGTPYVANESGTVAWDGYYFFWSKFPNFFGTGYTANNQQINGQQSQYYIDVLVYKNGSQWFSTNASGNVPRGQYATNNSAFNSGNNWESTTNIPININFPNQYLLIGDEITFKFRVRNPTSSISLFTYRSGTSFYNGNNVPLNVNLDLIKTLNGVDTTIYNESNAQTLTFGDSIFINTFIPKKIKMKDIITDISKRYNLIFTTDPDNSRKIIIESRDDYYGRGEIKDYSGKKDNSKNDKIQFLSEIQNKEILFSYKADKDSANESYSLSVDGDIYGQKKISFDNDFIKGERKVETPFSPTLSVYNSSNQELIVPYIVTPEAKCNIRTLYYAGLQPVLTSNWKMYDNETTSSVYNTYTTYPQALHVDDIQNPTIDINWGEVPFEWHSEQQTVTNNNLYQRYWSNTINQISQGKLLTTRLLLNEVDISYIKDNMNVKIFLQNEGYFYINKIVNYDPTSNDPTTVELIKIVDGIPFNKEVTDISVSTATTVFTGYEVLTASAKARDLGEYDNNVNSSENVLIVGTNNYIGENSENTIISGDYNVVSDNASNALILGGTGNTITSNARNSFIIGANNKTVSQDNEIWLGDDVQIIGGEIIISGVSSSDYCDTGIVTSLISGCSSSPAITLVDNTGNTIASFSYTSTTIGGVGTNVAGSGAFVAGGVSNIATGNSSTVIGGVNNNVGGNLSANIGGYGNIANGGSSFIGGGSGNNITSSASYSAIIGGYNNTTSAFLATTIGSYNGTASGSSIVIGGYANTAGGSYSSVMGGVTNVATGNRSSIIGGSNSVATSKYSGVFVGKNHIASNYHSVVIGGGYSVGVGNYGSTASGINSGVIGGHSNIVSGDNSVIIGGIAITGSSSETVYVPAIAFQNEDIRWRFIQLDIGDWDMDATVGINVAHSLSATEWKTVRQIDVMIRNDVDTQYHPLLYPNAGAMDGGISSTNIAIERDTGGFFDSTSFDSTSYNRGYITFWYSPD